MSLREDRMIRARLAYYDVRRAELACQGIPQAEANKIAYNEARRLKFDRNGKRKEG